MAFFLSVDLDFLLNFIITPKILWGVNKINLKID